MGYWGDAPWDNDYAADWFGAVFKKSKIDVIIANSLRKPVKESNRDEIRAAISLFILLGHVYVYNSDSYEEHLEQCISKNRELMEHWSNGGWDKDPEMEHWLENEKAVLERRRRNLGVSREKRPLIPEGLKEWWSKWID